MLILNSREKLLKILSSLKNRIASPSDIIAVTGLPRYEVLAAFHILEALDFIEPVYVRGNYKLYRLTIEGEKVVDTLSSGKKIRIEVELDRNAEKAVQIEALTTNVADNGKAVSETS